MKHVFFSVLVLLLALTLTVSFAANLKADIISIDFEDLSYADAVYDQYISDGIIFGDSLEQPITPGQIVTGYNSNNALGADLADPGIFILFTIPVYSVSTYVLEGPPPEYEPEPEPEPEPETDPEEPPAPEPESEEPEEPEPEPEEPSNTVYLRVFVTESYNLLNDGNTCVSAAGSWEEVFFSSEVPIAAVQLWGTQGFRIDDIVISTTAETVPEPVPEPTTMLLLGIGLTGFVCFRNRFKKGE